MESAYDKQKRAYAALREHTDFMPEAGLVLGSGLGGFVRLMRVVRTVRYSQIDGFPVSTAQGHEGRYVFGYLNGVPLAVMQGRVHYYEGYSMQDVVLPIRVMSRMGAKTLILTNAAGSVNKQYRAGDFMLIKGHISSFVPSALIGENAPDIGERFPDMSDVYDGALREKIRSFAQSAGIPLQEGVYLQTTGPNYESPQEVRMYGILGADAVGMSTACEAIAARHAGMRVCAVSCITNMAAGISEKPLSHREVTETAALRSNEFERLLRGIVTEAAGAGDRRD